MQNSGVDHNRLTERGTCREKRSAGGWWIRAALDWHHVRGQILGPVADCVDDGAAAYRAVRAGRARFARSRYLQCPELCVCGLQVKSKHRRRYTTHGCVFNEVAT